MQGTKHNINQYKHSINKIIKRESRKSARKIYSGSVTNAYIHSSKKEAPPPLV